MTTWLVFLIASNITCITLFILFLINYKAIAEEVQDKAQTIEESEKIRAKHISRLSHDLRTPLNAIMGYTSLLINKIHGEITIKQRQDLERIANNSEKIHSIIEDFFEQNTIKKF